MSNQDQDRGPLSRFCCCVVFVVVYSRVYHETKRSGLISSVIVLQGPYRKTSNHTLVYSLLKKGVLCVVQHHQHQDYKVGVVMRDISPSRTC